MSDTGTPKPGKGEKKARLAGRVLIFSLMVTGVIFLPTTAVLAVCMAPALVAALVDRNEPKTAWITVGAMNLTGALPAVFALWETGGRHLSDSLQVVSKPSVLLLAYGCAAIGWVIYNNVTPLVAGLVAGRNEKRLRDIGRRQKEIIRKWGEEVVRR